ncbi:hypothetical protein HanRHA438_Chr13g0625431 [Helianthus annuus]|nr:hypothetical protein HanRHA438_Chr13g0625431 [Helianthus annuus]
MKMGRFMYVLIICEFAARQLGFRDEKECPKLSKLASEYAKSSKANFKDDMRVYFSNEKEVESLCQKLDEELQRCILGYFAFHWSQASLMINQVLSNGTDERRLKDVFLKGTRCLFLSSITTSGA